MLLLLVALCQLPSPNDASLKRNPTCRKLYKCPYLNSVDEVPEDLMTAPLNILKKSECHQEMFKQNENMTDDMFESYYKELFPGGICASNQPKSACNGDSGGPFICEENGKAIISGIVSGGIDINFGN